MALMLLSGNIASQMYSECSEFGCSLAIGCFVVSGQDN